MKDKIGRLTPKTVLLMDGLGAVLTATLLTVVLKTFHEYFGMPGAILTPLSILALIFAIYSFSCVAFSRNHPQKLLKPIIVANLTYCALTLGLIIHFYHQLTILGLTYFVGEIILIGALVYVEIKTFKAGSQNGGR